MSFLVPGLAFGALAALVPIVIHLLNRSRYRVVRWGAMHLLDSVVRVNRRRVRLEQILLLLVRASIPVAIALFMARPVLTGWQTLPGDVKRSVVAALDDSYSMEAGGDDESAFARARRSLGRILDGLKRGSDAAVVTMSGGALPALEKPTSATPRLREGVAGLSAGFGTADSPAAIEKALGLFSEMGSADRELVVLSDFQRVSWGPGREAELRRLGALVGEMPLGPRRTLYPVGAGATENIAVEAIALSRFVVGVGQKVTVKASVRNHGERSQEGLRVHFRVDGAERETTEVALAPLERGQVLFAHTFDSAGSHHVEVAVDADPLGADNSLRAAIPVWNVVPVILVSGDPGVEPLEGETDYLEVALQPFAAGGRGLGDLIRPRVIGAGELDATSLGDARVVVLANVPTLTPQQVALLEDFARSGGGLLLFPGDRCDLGWYNAELPKGREGLLPFRIEGVAGSVDDRSLQTSVVGEHFDHQALALFNVPGNGTIAGAEVWRWCPLEVPAGTDAAGTGSATVLARLATGDPFLVEWKLGEGRVIFCATSCDPEWSPFPLRPSYVPLVGELITYLASTVYPPRNVSVGEELALFLPPERAGTRLAVTLPDGSRRQIEAVTVGPRAVASFAETRRPGLHVVSGDGVAPVHFVVNTDRTESDLARLSDEEIDAVAEILGAQVVRTPEAYEALLASHQHGREIWRHLLWAALGLIFAELLLEQLFARRRA